MDPDLFLILKRTSNVLVSTLQEREDPSDHRTLRCSSLFSYSEVLLTDHCCSFLLRRETSFSPLPCRDTPHPLKTWTVANPVVFSPLRTSYTGMRPKPYACGGCHSRNNVRETEFPTILVSDVLCSHTVSMPGIATRATGEVPTCWSILLAMTTGRTRPRRVAFFLYQNLHAQTLCLIGEQVANLSMRPLMQFLVIRRANIQVLPDITHIANDHRLHTLLIQCGSQNRRLLVFDILDLVGDLLELLLFRENESFATT